MGLKSKSSNKQIVLGKEIEVVVARAVAARDGRRSMLQG